ncbi:MAG: hypothetical protein IT436_06040 [Phycisphaerales bacterium]|nr:hypothetical protein [Phycisphaerales bacterium]
MNTFQAIRAVAAVTAVMSVVAPAFAHEGLMHIGRTSAGVLVITDFDFDDLFTLPPASIPLAGWAGEEPMFKGVDADDPGADVYALDAAAKISVEVILFSPGLKLWNHDLSLQVSQPGQSLSLGPLPFEDRTFWHLDSTDPAFDPSAGEWAATFRIIDAGSSAYTPSAEHTLRLTIPAPAGAGLFATALLTGRRRRAR